MADTSNKSVPEMAIKNMGYTPQKASDMGLGKMIIHQWMEWGSPEILTQPMWYIHVATAHWPQFTTLDPDQSFWITTGEKKTLVTWHFCKIQLYVLFWLDPDGLFTDPDQLSFQFVEPCFSSTWPSFRNSSMSSRAFLGATLIWALQRIRWTRNTTHGWISWGI